MLVLTTYGNENFQHSSAKYHVFACRCNENRTLNPAQKHLWIVGKEGDLGVSNHGSRNTVPAAPGYRQEFGKWTTAQYDVPEGLILKLFGMRKLQEMVNGRHTTASMLVATRAEAALIRVEGNLTADHRATTSRVVLFEGRADVLEINEGVRRGVITNDRDVQQFASFNQDALFTVTLLQDELAAAPVQQVTTVENTQGERVQVTTIRRRRAIQL